MGSQFANAQIPPEILEHLREIYPEHEDFEDVLQDQESVYQSLQSISQINDVRSTNSDQSSDMSHISGNGAQISRSESIDSELAEALALSLHDFENVSISESAGTAAGSRGSSSTDTSIVVAASQDDVDTDRMTYEQLQSLTEAVGIESRGLAKELISSLPSQKFKDKSGWFAPKKNKNEGCVICYMEYKHGEYQTTLPCMHQYHMKCIQRWLEDHKTCPICTTEISLSAT